MPAFNPSTLTPLFATVAIGWIYYKRIRRSFGRQPYQAKRALLRVGLLALLLVGLVITAATVPHVAAAIALGLLVGGGLGVLALRHTHIEAIEGAHWYTPNPWIGGALSLLLVARLAWRYGHGAFSSGAAQAAQNANPLTLGIAATLVAFYVVNGAGLAWRMRALTAQA